MPDREIIVVNKGGNPGTIALLITAIGGIAAALWWFLPKGWSRSAGKTPEALHFKLDSSGLSLDGTVMVPAAGAAIAKQRGVSADVRVSGDTTEGTLSAVKAAFAAAEVPLSIWLAR